MIDLKTLRQNVQNIEKNLINRNITFNLNSLVALDKKITSEIQKNEKKKNARNFVTQQIARNQIIGAEKEKLILETRKLGQEIKETDQQLRELEKRKKQQLSMLPNLLQKDVPFGKDENDNQEICRVGDVTKFAFNPQSHYKLGENLKILDIARGVRMSQRRFALLKGLGAMLERALALFMLDLHTKEHGYQEWQTPFLVHSSSIYNTGQLPKFAEDLFKTTDELYLIPTAEVPLTNIYREEILTEHDLPLQLTAYTPCFRSEAGSYSKDTKGLMRQHQFSKVELVWLTTPQYSQEAHRLLVRHAETVLEKLELPYRTLLLCSGDTGFSASKCYDLEVWFPFENTYREISSCSNCLEFQARRANIKYQPKSGGKPIFVHTLNGSGLAVGRTWAALLENYQQEDGSIKIPKVLQSYMKGLTVLK